MMKFLIVILIVVGVAAADDLVNLAAGNPKLTAALFRNFEKDMGRDMSSPAEVKLRLANFNKFVKEAARLNAESDNIRFGITLFADMTEAEFEQHKGLNASRANPNRHSLELTNVMTPTQASWKDRYGTPKDQGHTMACWAFATVGVLEGYNTAFNNNQYVALSEQEAADCTEQYTIARGGWYGEALEGIQSRNHLATSASYPFTRKDAICNYKQHANSLSIKITGIHEFTGDASLVTALASGPVAVAMHFDIKLAMYEGGIWDKDSCNAGEMDHAVVAVGYTPTYWEIRNSFGTTWWGEQGYGRFTRAKANICLISTAPVRIEVEAAAVQEEQE